MTRAEIPGAAPGRRVVWPGRGGAEGFRLLPTEAPVALIHNASTTAVMMATPLDLEDLGRGFSLSEGLVDRIDQIRSVEVVASDLGFEVRMWLDEPRAQALAARRRRMAGPTGCGLCGVESLEEAVRPPPRVKQNMTLTPGQVLEAVAALSGRQVLGDATRAVHAAGYWRPEGGMAAVREDVGRHNALDKLIGALRPAEAPGAVVLTSRVSVEMVQKCAVLGAPILIAVSAPTTLAVSVAEAAGVTLVAIARPDGFEVFTHGDRIAEAADGPRPG